MARSTEPPRVVAVIAHPDDEAYSMAGTLARLAAHGAVVRILSMTRGEGGNDRRGAPSTPQELAATRTAELEASCRVLGANDPEWLDVPDGGIADVDAAGLRERLTESLRGCDLVVTLGEDGAYGHPDHLACTALVHEARARLDRPALLLAQFPRDAFARVRRGLARAGLNLDRDRPLGIRRDEADLRVRLGEGRARKLAAVAAHGSQLRDGDPQSFLDGRVLQVLLDEEWFTLAPGSPPLPPALDTLLRETA